jgi:hypothetical protein
LFVTEVLGDALAPRMNLLRAARTVWRRSQDLTVPANFIAVFLDSQILNIGDCLIPKTLRRKAALEWAISAAIMILDGPAATVDTENGNQPQCPRHGIWKCGRIPDPSANRRHRVRRRGPLINPLTQYEACHPVMAYLHY